MKKRLLREAGPHLSVAFGFALLAIAWTFPLVLHLSTHLPGADIGDNAIFFWNFWWMRVARASGTDFFHSAYLLAPAGADLTLHTHTALPAFVGATLLGRFGVATALNVTTLASLALNGFAAYLLAWRTTGQRHAAVLAGIIFATSPYIAAHLNGHFNLTAAWTIPLFALGLADVVRGSVRWSVFAGLVLAVTTYVDYYYLVYEIALLVCAVALSSCAGSVEWFARPRRPRLTAALLIVIALDLALIVLIFASGGIAVHAGRVLVSARDTFNPLQLLWILIAAALWTGLRPKVRIELRSDWSTRRAVTGVTIVGALLAIGSAPVLWNGIRLFADGQYVTQHYYWRNAPIGIDVLTLLLGNPFHSIWGAPLRHVYLRLGIDLVESGAWLGIVPAALAALAVRRRSSDPAIRCWTVLGGVFLVWALGSHVHAAGRNIGLIAPEALLRYVPIAANARMPGRAMVVVYLAMAVLAATTIARMRSGRRSAIAMALAALILADFWITPLPLSAIACPPIYEVLRDRPESGAVAELPLGLGDGFGDVTPGDRHMLVCQSVHGRPVVGGFLARLSQHVLELYRADPLIATWLRFSGARNDEGTSGTAADAAVAAERMNEDGIGFVLLNRRAASPELREYVEHVMPLTIVSQDGDRTLFVRSAYPSFRRMKHFK